MPKGVQHAILVVLVLMMLFAVPFLRVAQANPIYTPGRLTLAIIESPKNGMTYTTNTIPVTIRTGDHQFPSTGYYSVDGGQETKINENVHGEGTYKTTLHLADGQHTIHVRTETLGSACATTTFTIDTTLPYVTILSPQNKVYNTSTIPLHIELLSERLFNEYDVTDKVTYNLDGQGNTSVRVLIPFPPQFPEELTWYPLANLTDGPHNVVVYAQDDIGNVFSAQVKFEVNTANPSATPSIVPSATVQNTGVYNNANFIFSLTFVFALVLATVGVLVILFKRRRSKS